MPANSHRFSKGSAALFHVMAAASLIAAPSACTAPPTSPAALSATSRPVANAGRCEALAGRAIGSGRVTSAVSAAAGSPTTGSLSSGGKAEAAICIVRLVLQPVPGSTINAEVWLPEQWNGKLMGFGGGGFDGSLNADSWKFLNPVIVRGFASVISDVGHTPTPTPGMWIHGNRERVVDFGHRGTHLAAQAAKQVISAFYGAPARFAYFQGCSNGGRDGLSLASRYPQDYDAIVAGAPAIRYTEVVTQLLWYSSATRSAGGKLESKLGLVHDAILKQCDALDGVTDGILENPRACNFDPAVLQCRQGDAASCLTAPEVGALRRIYGGARLTDGSLLIAPPAPGSEGNPGNWAAWITGPVPGIAGEEFYRWMVYDNPQWKAAQFDLDRDYGFARTTVVPVINADNPDLSAFIRRGGKLIIYQGWDDPAITAGSTIDYFEAMHRTVGPRANRQTRLFMVPGMAHCGGGPGATAFDMQAAMERWVETGKAPDSVRGTKPDVPAGQEPYTHPLCAWPATAHYNGAGSVRNARNFTCKVGRSGV